MSILNMIEKGLSLILYIIDFYILYIVFKRFLGFKIKSQYIIIAMLIIPNVPFFIVEKFNIESIYQWIPAAIYFFSFSLIFCNGTCFKKIIVTIIYNCFNEIFQYITVPLIFMSNYIYISNSPYQTEQIKGIVNQIFLIISRFLYILILNFILEYCWIDDRLKDFKYTLLFVIPNVFIVALLCEYFKLYYKNNNVNNSLFNNIKMLGFASMALVCAVFTVITLDRLIKENVMRQKELLLRQQFNMQTEHYKNLQIQSKNTRAFKHDINNHLICIKNLIADGDIKSTEVYLKKITKSLESLNLKVNTGNPFADAVISEKYNISIDKNIDFKCNVKILADTKIDSFDLCVILGNALDNAIEACEKITDKSIKKYIHITSIVNKSFIVFEIKNSMEGYINKDYVLTDKIDNINHGLGLLNIESITNKYCGTTYIESSENMFVLNIMLQVL
ncbi:GHKL domain-containing protein [Clostridium botulinum]|uniref:sensor histidine kinase n=4 Tax=Clostridium TaxID=1485 RepID=UPI00090B79F9|nr:GHKL domain protein [Clostridium sporogenes]MBD5637396.1 GHKL domain-containing protein [Clostridium botulinum]MDI6919747.1 GHKL domain-containing protein [Clostridium botulinum]